MFIAYIVRNSLSGHAITVRVIAVGVVGMVVSAVIFGALIYWIRIKQMKDDGL